MKFARDTSPELKSITEACLKHAEFKDLAEAQLRILYIWRDKPRKDEDGRTVAARVSKLSPRWRDVLKKDVEIEVCETVWRKLDATWRRRLIEHELRHIALERQPEDESRFVVDKEGRLTIKLVPHDLVIRTFKSEIKAWGFDIGDIDSVRFIAEAHKRVKLGKLKTYELPEILRPPEDEEVEREEAA